MDGHDRFVGVNAIRVGPDGALWVVDRGSPGIGKPAVAGGSKLVRIDVATNRVDRIIDLAPVGRPWTFIDDVRFNGANAYLTDAGAPGLVVLDIASGKGRRVLEGHPSTVAQSPLMAEGKPAAHGEGRSGQHPRRSARGLARRQMVLLPALQRSAVAHRDQIPRRSEPERGRAGLPCRTLRRHAVDRWHGDRRERHDLPERRRPETHPHDLARGQNRGLVRRPAAHLGRRDVDRRSRRPAAAGRPAQPHGRAQRRHGRRRTADHALPLPHRPTGSP